MVDVTVDLVHGTATYLHVHPRGKEVSGLSSTRHRSAAEHKSLPIICSWCHQWCDTAHPLLRTELCSVIQPLTRNKTRQPTQKQRIQAKVNKKLSFRESLKQRYVSKILWVGLLPFNIYHNESPSGLKLKDQKLSNISLFGFCMKLLVHVAQSSHLHLLSVLAC